MRQVSVFETLKREQVLIIQVKDNEDSCSDPCVFVCTKVCTWMAWLHFLWSTFNNSWSKNNLIIHLFVSSWNCGSSTPSLPPSTRILIEIKGFQRTERLKKRTQIINQLLRYVAKKALAVKVSAVFLADFLAVCGLIKMTNNIFNGR